MIYIPIHQPLLNEQLVDWPPLSFNCQQVGPQRVFMNQLIYLSGEHNYSWLHRLDGSRLLVPHTLKRVLARLPKDSFIRIHRSYVVNRQFVERIETNSNSNHLLYLSTEHVLPVPRRNWVEVRQQMQVQRHSSGHKK